MIGEEVLAFAKVGLEYVIGEVLIDVAVAKTLGHLGLCVGSVALAFKIEITLPRECAGGSAVLSCCCCCCRRRRKGK